MDRRFYRFRSARALLDGFEELERQEIFFSLPDELNDPMEGFRNVVWAGDRVLWRNLLRHYLFCLFRAATMMVLLGPEFDLARCSDLVRETDEDFPLGTLGMVVGRLWDEFFRHEAARLFVEDADRLRIRLKRDGLRNYLRMLQPVAIEALFRISALQGVPIVQPADASLVVPPELAERLSTMLRAHAEVPEASDVLFEVAERTALQLDLIADVASMTSGAQASHLLFLVRDFPRFYSDALEGLIFPDWATACFAEDASDPAMWGIYGDGHRGACLIFRNDGEANGSPLLPLDWMVGLEAPNQEPVSIRQTMTLPFVQVRYANEYPEIDFFTSIGTLARSKLASFWYSGPNGARSPAAEIVLSENEEWRSGYWRSHALTTTTKLPQWSREREHRLVLTTNFVRHGDAGSRKLCYRFGDLAGVAFGAKMAHADKLKIMRIIDRKAAAEGRSDFEFYQAGYEGRTGDVALHRLSLLRFTT